jgi:hypothetical protein
LSRGSRQKVRVVGKQADWASGSRQTGTGGAGGLGQVELADWCRGNRRTGPGGADRQGQGEWTYLSRGSRQTCPEGKGGQGQGSRQAGPGSRRTVEREAEKLGLFGSRGTGTRRSRIRAKVSRDLLGEQVDWSEAGILARSKGTRQKRNLLYPQC